MAINEYLPGVEVAFTVNGTDLKEYPDTDPDSAGKTTVQYIEATTDQVFAIRMRINEDFRFAGNCVCFWIEIDGTHMDSLNYKKAEQGQNKTSTGVHVDGALRRYQFTGVETGKVSPASKDDVVLTIVVSDVCVLTGEFSKLKDLAALKALMVIPRTPTPQPLKDRDADDLTIDELQELHRRSQASRKEKEARVKVKQEDGASQLAKRTVAISSATSTQLTLDDDGNVRQESSQAATSSQPEIIELD